MKRKTLGLIHTSTTIVPVFQQLCREQLPNIRVFNIVDDSLIQEVIECGGLSPLVSRRLATQINLAEQAGADTIMVTCSSVGPAVDAAAPFSRVPLIRVDQPMADQAISCGSRIGVLATLPTTLEPTGKLIENRASLAKKTITVTELLCEGAFDALLDGDLATHDAIVIAKLLSLAPFVDVIVLAQASMARIVDRIPPGEVSIDILSSPRPAVAHLSLLMN